MIQIRPLMLMIASFSLFTLPSQANVFCSIHLTKSDSPDVAIANKIIAIEGAGTRLGRLMLGTSFYQIDRNTSFEISGLVQSTLNSGSMKIDLLRVTRSRKVGTQTDLVTRLETSTSGVFSEDVEGFRLIANCNM